MELLTAKPFAPSMAMRVGGAQRAGDDVAGAHGAARDHQLPGGVGRGVLAEGGVARTIRMPEFQGALTRAAWQCRAFMMPRQRIGGGGDLVAKNQIVRVQRPCGEGEDAAKRKGFGSRRARSLPRINVLTSASSVPLLKSFVPVEPLEELPEALPSPDVQRVTRLATARAANVGDRVVVRDGRG